MGTTATPRKSRPRSSSKAAVAAPAPVAEPTTATAVMTRPPLSETINLHEVFLADGTFTKRDTFKYNVVTGGAYAYRKALFIAISKLTPEQVMAFERPARNVMFALVKNEYERYLGTAIRRQDNPAIGAKAGEPLPKLSFNSGADAVSYRECFTAAGAALRKGVFGN